MDILNRSDCVSLIHPTHPFMKRIIEKSSTGNRFYISIVKKRFGLQWVRLLGVRGCIFSEELLRKV